jgi:tRNA(Ile)-lysidine synthase
MDRDIGPNVFDVFCHAMRACGPFEPHPRLAVAVSGGADSMSLALLAKTWLQPLQGSLLGLVIDHGLRPESAEEADVTAARLTSLEIPVRQARLSGLQSGPALAERARTARYQCLTALCIEAGISHLLLGHQAADQAETVVMRGLRFSGPAGFAAMPLVAEHARIRLIRPLLALPPARLRAMLRGSGVDWVEDPSNANKEALRPRLRALRADAAGIGAATAALVQAAQASGRSRAEHDSRTAQDLSACAELRPEGFAILSPGPMRTGTLATLIQAISGAAYAPPASQVGRLAREPRPGTLAGVRIMPAGRLGSGLLMVREAAAMTAAVPASSGAIWDGRFRLTYVHHGFRDDGKSLVIGPVGDDVARLRSWSDLPAAVVRTLPALRRGNGLVAVPHIGYPDPCICERVRVVFAPARAAAAAPFFAG